MSFWSTHDNHEESPSLLTSVGSASAGRGSRVTENDPFPALLVTVYLIMRQVTVIYRVRTSFEDSFRSGRPNAVANDEKVHSIQKMVEQD